MDNKTTSVAIPMLSRDIFEKRIEGNAQSIINAFMQQARKDEWTLTQIDTVVEIAKDGDYDHLIQTFMKHCP